MTTVVHEVRLELVRPGPPHNQLLSPLTQYMALCGEGSSVTFNIGLEHHQLLTRLERLRYMTADGDRAVEVPPAMREAELADLGNEVARILSAIPTLSTALGRAQGTDTTTAGTPPQALVHLRLVLSGSELSLIPFELGVAPQGYPGEGLEFCLQSSLPIVLTREVRRARPRLVSWNVETPPKILFVFAEPAGMTVPAKEHAHALRAAIEPWVESTPVAPAPSHVAEAPAPPAAADADGEPQSSDPLARVKKHLRILPNASIEKIYQACTREHFTHVHILAHGAEYWEAGVKRFGVALCHDATGALEVVSGKRLEKALRAANPQQGSRCRPLVVTLATCDSGNQRDVMAPGGSIAHDLHSEGIPWVFASQFPLTKIGSVRFVESVYPRLLLGDDPREVLFEARRTLFVTGKRDHDWASIVAYGSLPDRFTDQVDDFRSAQIRRAIEVALDFADQDTLATAPSDVEQAIREVENLLERWRTGLSPGSSPAESLQRAMVAGMHGTTYKRIAFLRMQVNSPDEAIKDTLRQSLLYYEQALAETAALADKYYWTATNCLSLATVLQGKKDRETYELDRRLAEKDTTSSDRSRAAWAHAALAELEILRKYHTGRSGDAAKVERHCKRIVALMGPDSFHVGSTWRQFQRYRTQFERYLGASDKAHIDTLAGVAMKALHDGEGAPKTDSPVRGRRAIEP